MLPSVLKVAPSAARRFLVHALLLDDPAPDIDTVLTHLGYVQIDPINVCGRMHDLILRNRVRGYREGDLIRHLHGDKQTLSGEDRLAFEHHLPSTNNLAAFPFEAWPHMLAAMRARSQRSGAWSGRLTAREREAAPGILAAIKARGALGPDSFQDGRRSRPIWGTATLAKSTMQKLFFHGKLLISRRENNRRIYDLPERILPASVLTRTEPPAADTARWLAILKLRQHRLVRLKRGEVSIVGDLAQPVAVEGCPTLFCLNEDAALLEQVAASDSRRAPKGGRPLLLAPLDPLIYDRSLMARLWGFDYTWEAYTPPAKRKRGYYALPILAGTELVGHVDPKADRERRKLVVVSRRVRRGVSVAAAIKELSRFLGLTA